MTTKRAKRCSKCKQTKPVGNFDLDCQKRDGLRSACKACRSAYAQGYNSTARGKASMRQRQLKHHYGITQDDYDLLLAQQDGRCAVCGMLPNGKPQTNGAILHVDHNHATGQVRSLLCQDCNQAIGLLKEDPALFDAAKRYVLQGRNWQPSKLL